MRKYIDGLGYEYQVPDHCVPEFERRRRNLLIIAIIGKSLLLIGLICLGWFWR